MFENRVLSSLLPPADSTSPLKKRKELPAMELSRKSSISTDSWSTCVGTCSTDTHCSRNTNTQVKFVPR